MYWQKEQEWGIMVLDGNDSNVIFALLFKND